MTNELQHNVSTGARRNGTTTRLARIWADITNGQRRFDAVNRPWMSKNR